jgi:hypothetical protein
VAIVLLIACGNAANLLAQQAECANSACVLHLVSKRCMGRTEFPNLK